MIKGITKNSKEVQKDFIYCCFEGKVSGYDYIQEALNNGAVKIIGEKDLDFKEYEKVDDVNQAMTKYSKQIYNNPDEKLKLIGVTGTDGKTSIALIVDQILNKFSKSSYLGTNGFFINGEEQEYSDFTTPFADKLYKNLNDSVKQKSKYFVMEVSSHSLSQKRIYDLKYDICIFSNLSNEHLDFHKTMDNYYESKKSLFKMLKQQGKAVVNIDDKYGQKLASEIDESKLITISSQNKNADYYINNIKSSINNTKFDLYLKKENKTYNITSPLLADFNAYNLTQAIACVTNLGSNIEEIIKIINDIVIPGRLEIIKNNLGLNIIIDFAHTPEAIKKVIEFINDKKENSKIHVLTGSAGQRDKEKRPMMGLEAAKHADYIYLTEDDPRDEEVLNIISHIKKGIKNNNCIVVEEVDRKKAIQKMISNAQEGDILVLFGKGSMKKMYYDGFTTDYEEKKVVNEIIKEGKND